MPSAITVRQLQHSDREAWNGLWQGYLTFYGTEVSDATTNNTWARLINHNDNEMIGLCAVIDQQIGGFTHLIFHPSTWSQIGYFYLEDLFTHPDVRGQGLGGALIEAAADISRERGVGRLYWSTQSTNTQAQALYNKVAKASGFIQYRKPL